MTIVDDFYRGREIIEKIQRWTEPITVDLNEANEYVQVGFRSGLSEELTKTEKFKILQMIERTLSREYGSYGDRRLAIELVKELKGRLKKVKLEIKKDFNIPIYKGDK